MSNPPFYTYRQFMIQRYGTPLYRVPIDPGFGCPHRADDGTGGCTFCAGDGNRAGYTAAVETVRDQIAVGLAFARRRYQAAHFLAYVQAFTGTHARPDEVRALLEHVLETYPFKALAIGTRPDCLPAAMLDVLQAIGRRTDLWVELGVQTVHDDTLRHIRRGHDWAGSKAAIEALHARSIAVAVHVILGLPGETADHFRKTAETLSRLPIGGIKIHNLHVVRGTQLETEFQRTPFMVPDEAAYAEILIDFLRRLPDSVPIMRVVTDTPDKDLVAPRWHMSKGAFLAFLRDEMAHRNVRQGDRWEAGQ